MLASSACARLPTLRNVGRRALDVALALLVTGVGAVTAVGFLDGRVFPGELLALFRLQYAVAGFALALAAAFARRWRTAAAAGAIALVNALGLLPALLDGARPDPERPQLRLLVANVWYPGEHHDRLAALVQREQPDVVALTELTFGWASALDRRLREHRHRLLEPQRSAYGLGLYSRRRLHDARVVRLGGKPPIVGRATLAVGGKRLELFLVHAPGVIGSRPAARQREFMRRLGEQARAAGPTALVCGDINAAPWSAPLRELLREGRLQPADPWRPGEWTFPAWNRALGTPIDQCLAGEGVAVSTRIGPAFGSDHLPLLVDVALR